VERTPSTNKATCKMIDHFNIAEAAARLKAAVKTTKSMNGMTTL